MGAEDIGQASELVHAAPTLPSAVPAADKRRFRIGLASAAALHALLIVGIVGAGMDDPQRRRLGATGGLDDGVAIELVDEADLMSKSSVGDRVPPPPKPQQAEKPAQQQQETQAAEPQNETQPQPPQKPVERTQPQKQNATALAKETPDLLTVPDLTGRPPERPAEKHEQRPQRQQPQQPQQHQQRTNPSPKAARPQQPMIPSDTMASLSRPAGITRSGENDDFARGVIRALRQTMPSSRGSFGRVTIHFLLSETGNMVEVRVLRTTADPLLTQNVVFASKQSSFPIPPTGSTVADRTFMVTYIYE